MLLILVLSERPGRGLPRGGESVVAKSSPSATPPTRAFLEQETPPQQEAAPSISPQFMQAPALDSLPPGVTLSGPGFDTAPPAVPPSAPGETPPLAETSPGQPPLPARPPSPPRPRDRASEDASPAALPWQGERPAARGNNGQDFANLPRPGSASVDLPGRSDIRGWARSTAREFVGGVDADGMPLYRFDVWLEAPENVRAQVRSVTYEYQAPSAQPPSQSSGDAASGFRVKFGAASCAEKATITLVMTDGQERSASVDGCKILE